VTYAVLNAALLGMGMPYSLLTKLIFMKHKVNFFEEIANFRADKLSVLV
jgi:hypothetical protein